MLGGVEHVERLDVVVSLHLQVLVQRLVEELGNLLLVVVRELEFLRSLLELQRANHPDVKVPCIVLPTHLAGASAAPRTSSSSTTPDPLCTRRPAGPRTCNPLC